MNTANSLPELARFQSVLKESELDPRCVNEAGARVAKLVLEFESLPHNRAGRRVRREARADVRKTIRHLTTAIRVSGDGSPTRNRARKLIRFAGRCTEFPELRRRASAFRGHHNRVIRRLNEQSSQARAREIRIDAVHRAREVKSGRYLKSVGKALRNCVGGDGFTLYYNELRSGETEFWVLLRGAAPVGLLTICSRTREISQCAGMDNEPIGCGRNAFIALQRELNAHGDDMLEIADVGAFSLFATEPDISPTAVDIGRARYRVWGRRGEVILCDELGDWSRFVFRRYARIESVVCEPNSGNLDEGSLLALVLDSTALATAINRFRPPSPRTLDVAARIRR